MQNPFAPHPTYQYAPRHSMAPPPPAPGPAPVRRRGKQKRSKVRPQDRPHDEFDTCSMGVDEVGDTFDIDSFQPIGDVMTIDDNSEDGDLTQALEKGSRFETKDLYCLPREDYPNEFYWADKKPLSFGDAVKIRTTKKLRETFAINLFHRYDKVADDWFVSELHVNSPEAQVALEIILQGYPGLTKHELRSFRSPFLPFIHRWKDLIAYSQRPETSESVVPHLTYLQKALEPLLKESFEKVKEIESTGHVAFKDLPLVYVPGMIVIDHATDAAGIVRSCNLSISHDDVPYYDVRVDVVDWDGRKCGLVSQNWSVYYYHGLRALKALDVSPMDGLPDKDDIRQKLISRGRMFEKLRGQFYMSYSNKYEDKENERVIVDARAYYKHEIPFPPIIGELTEMGQLTWEQAMNRLSVAPPIHVDWETESDLSPLTDEQCLLARPTLWCFKIAQKRWEQLKLTNLHEVRWVDQAFDNLVLDQGEKDLILALVEQDNCRKDKPWDDFIEGKGQGMIMLLCGPPGVGKTLTAETVAEHLRRPLYKLGPADLGTEARVVEQFLSKTLNLCADFGAILLLDEADVFMEARSANDLARNELVAVFLRLLEYYQGIMILTTNRICSIDPAFESRIDITLSYNPLSQADRRKIWKNFLSTLDSADMVVCDADLDELAKWDFNGRQIKSAVKTARILAARKREPLKLSHLEVVLKLRSKALGVISSEANNRNLRGNA